MLNSQNVMRVNKYKQKVTYQIRRNF